MNESNPTRPQGSLSPLLSEEVDTLRRQAEIDLEVTMREHRYDLDQILMRQKAVLRALILTLIAFIAVAGTVFIWLRHGDSEELLQRKLDADREVAELRKRNEEAQALVESFRELERAWKRRLIEAAGARPADDLSATYPAPNGTGTAGPEARPTPGSSASPSESSPSAGPTAEPGSKTDGSKAVKP